MSNVFSGNGDPYKGKITSAVLNNLFPLNGKNDFWTDCTNIQFPVKCIFLRTLSSKVSQCGLVVLSYIIKVNDLEEECLDCDHAVCWNVSQAQSGCP